MIQVVMHSLLYLFEINNHPLVVQLFCATMHGYFPIVTVKSLARTVVGEVKPVTSGYLHRFFDDIHCLLFENRIEIGIKIRVFAHAYIYNDTILALPSGKKAVRRKDR